MPIKVAFRAHAVTVVHRYEVGKCARARSQEGEGEQHDGAHGAIAFLTFTNISIMARVTQGRDYVPAAQERVVIARSGDACAYPGCGISLTLDADHDQDRPKAVGKVAHIAAASVGGPRYDETMTAAERGSAANLIYLCGPHHDAIDAQLNLHTREYLMNAKADHETTVARAVRYALGSVTYEELSLVCSVVGRVADDGQRSRHVDLALPLQEKIELNALGDGSVVRIADGLSQANRVAAFVAFQNGIEAGFGRSLASRMKADYYTAVADGLAPDEVFDYLVTVAFENAGPTNSPGVRAAALAVIAYLFEICEIFERE